jgi:hypothetical protein
VATPITTVARVIERLSIELQVTPRQVELLLTIYELKSIGLTDLAELYDIRSNTAETHVLKLVEKGWVERKSYSEDDRFSVIADRRKDLTQLLSYHVRTLRYLGGLLTRKHSSRAKTKEVEVGVSPPILRHPL